MSLPNHISCQPDPSQPILQREDYTVACICPTAVEFAPVQALLDEEHRPLPTLRDYNSYCLGRLGPHNIVLTVLPQIGNHIAATVAIQLRNDFPNVQYGFLVGMGGGLPDENHDIRLGDVVVSQPKDVFGGVVQYDRGKIVVDGFTQRTGSIDKPPAVLLSSIQRLKARYDLEGSRISQHIQDFFIKFPPAASKYDRPAPDRDMLFDSGYRHRDERDNETCNKCDRSFLKKRTVRADASPKVHYGTIGSANLVLKNSMVRDSLRRDLDVMCVDMESAGILDALPCLVIRGICDYADSHKSKEWQPYASATAAAYLKELLHLIPSKDTMSLAPVEGLPYSTRLPSMQTGDYLIGHSFDAHYSSHSTSLMQSVSRRKRPQECSQQLQQEQQAIVGRQQVYICENDSEARKATVLSDRIPRLAPSSSALEPAEEQPSKMRRISPAEEPDDEALREKDDIQVYRDLLSFDEMDSRHATIQSALAQTCEWITGRPEFQAWKDIGQIHEHHGFLWIKGKPAAGKSTAMKYMLEQAKSTQSSDLILSFFFNARGSALEKSIEGMYRSLLLQLLQARPDLSTAFAPLLQCQTSNSWPVEIFQTVFRQAVVRLGEQSLTCFIDALDECDEDEIRDMVAFLEEVANIAVSSKVRFSVCFSSRHYPNITVERGLEIVLEDQDGHAKDITTYISNKLRGGRRKQMASIKDEISQRASGVFLWVVLVVKILNKAYDKGQTRNLEERLKEIPNGLQELFEDILTRGDRNMDVLILCLQWILYAKRPLQSEELYYAVLTEIDPDEATYQDGSSCTCQEDMDRFILDASRGLAEKTKGRTPVIQFIHESVREFLLKGDSIRTLRPEFHEKLMSRHQEKLLACCLSYLKMNRDFLEPAVQTPHDASREHAKSLRNDLSGRLPFIRYATQYLFDHADAALEQGSKQVFTSASLEFELCRDTFNFLERYQTRRHEVGASILQISTKKRLTHLVRHVLEHEEFMDDPEDVAASLYLAVSVSCKPCIVNILEACLLHTQQSTGTSLEPSKDEIEPALNVLLAYPQREKKHRHLLSWAALQGSLELVKVLLATGLYDINGASHHSDIPALHAAASGGHEEIVQLLLSRGAEQIYRGGYPVSYAIKAGNLQVVQLLLGSATEPHRMPDHTSLNYAVGSGNLAMVQYLVETWQIDINRRWVFGISALEEASGAGHVHIVEYLLSRPNINVNKGARSHSTALIEAASKGYWEIVELLLKNKSLDQDLKDIYGRTACMRASANGYDTILQLLTLDRSNLLETNATGENAFWLAARNGHADAFLVLFRAYQDTQNHAKSSHRMKEDQKQLSQKDSEGLTLLMAAVLGQSTAIVELLINHVNLGEDVNALTESGENALSHAVKAGVPEILQLLLSVGCADVHLGAHANSGLVNLALRHTPKTNIENARALGDHQMQLMLLEKKNRNRHKMARKTNDAVVVEPSDSQLLQTLSEEVAERSPPPEYCEIVKMLLQHGEIDINRPDPDGELPLNTAVLCQKELFNLFLMQDSIDLNAQDKDGVTALHMAVQYRRPWMVRRLLHTGKIDTDKRTACGKTPLDVATELCYHEIADMLYSLKYVNPLQLEMNS